MYTVMNLATGKKQKYTCCARDSVIAAYAQSRNDWNTWDYESRYGGLVEEGEYTFLCGDFCAFKDGRNFD